MLENFKKMSKIQQEKTLKKWADAYYNEDAPLISDAEYDKCYNEYKSKYGEFDYLGEADDSFKKFVHPIPVTSLKKVNTLEAYDEMYAKFESNVVIEPKYDGLTLVYYPDGKFVSRGNGSVGEILPFAGNIPGLPGPGKFEYPVRMEVMINKQTFNKLYKDSAKTPRNLAAGILRRKTYTDDIHQLTYVAYNLVGCSASQSMQLAMLREAGFNTTCYIDKDKADNGRELFDKALGMMNLINKVYPTDGMVIKYNGENGYKFGSTAHHPKDMFAYKFKSSEKESVLKNVVWSMGRGRLTPVAVFEPVELNGAFVSRASLHNPNIMKKLNLKIGSKISVTLKNEIIPQIVKSDGTGHKILIPTTCPYCGSQLRQADNSELYCDHPACGILAANCLRLVSKQGLDIKDFSEQTINKAMEYIQKNKKQSSALDLLDLQTEDFVNMGFTPYMSEKLYGNIVRSKTNVPMDKFLAALGIPLLGATASRKLAEAYESDLHKMIEDFESDIPGGNSDLGPVLINNIGSNLDFIRHAMLVIDVANPTEKEEKTGKSYTVAITGKLSIPRNAFEEWLKQSNCVLSSSLTKKCDYLITNDDDPNSSKAVKAQKYGVKIISESDFVKLLGGTDEDE